eukprot:TRINITY_DN571_c0_g2_i4.p1 TRINITY_DN571_c0_g2~~TRINITY_DN571_c0_g2_i4.p1  ORF type:complete len:752 (+),score=107.88 TRINITY_DN571_c0_g2_i4:334-2589(+)
MTLTSIKVLLNPKLAVVVNDSERSFRRGTDMGGSENFIIRDNSTGLEYDIRDQYSSLLLIEADQRLTKIPENASVDPWNNWWKQKHRYADKFANAAEKGEVEVMADLLDVDKHGDLAVNVNFKGLDGFTPLHYAVAEGQLLASQFLIENGAEVNSVSDSLRTPLHIACSRNSIDLMKLLADAGANVNVQDNDGDTPLHVLSELGFTEGVKWLLGEDPDLSIKNKYGEIAFDVAATVEVREVFAESMRLEKSSNNYSRTVMDGLVLHNNRADVIKGFIFKAQLIETEDRCTKEESKPNANGKVTSDNQSSANKSRVAKILQAAEKMRTVVQEESKEFPKDIQETEDCFTADDFDVINIIGKGSFGQVYLVKLKRNNTLYAMKVLEKKKVKLQNSFRYVKTEKDIMRVSKHPFIVRLHFAFQNADKLFMIMQYCPGYFLDAQLRGDLGRVMNRELRLTEDRARIYISEVLLALADLHKRDIIFRDLKPENVVLDEDGHALLTDFGLSKEGVVDNIATYSFCGSLAYLAPEIVRRKGHGKSVDWYLLGVLLYELVVGQPPYFSTNRNQLLRNIQTARLKLPLFLSSEVKSLLIGLLDRNPQKRLGSGKEDAEEIKAHPWFRGVNWRDVLERRLIPPKPTIRRVVKKGSIRNVFTEQVKTGLNIDEWNYSGKLIVCSFLQLLLFNPTCVLMTVHNSLIASILIVLARQIVNRVRDLRIRHHTNKLLLRVIAILTLESMMLTFWNISARGSLSTRK